MSRIIQPRTTFDSISGALAAYPTMQAGEVGVIMHEGAPVHSWVMTGTGVSVNHPGQDWLIPTEILESGSYGFTIDAGSLTSGAALGDQIVYDVTSSNAPELSFVFPAPATGQFYIPAQVSARFSVSTSATMDNGAMVMGLGFERPSTNVVRGGIKRDGGVWKSVAWRTGPTEVLSALNFSDSHLTDNIEWLDLLMYSQNSNAPLANCNVGPHAVYGNSTNGYYALTQSGENYVDTAKVILDNTHPGTGGNATVTITHLMVCNHVAERTAA